MLGFERMREFHVCDSALRLELERFRLQKNRDYKYFANFDPLITIRLLWQKVIFLVVIDYF